MKLFKLTRTDDHVSPTYDYFDSIVVAAESEEAAKKVCPVEKVINIDGNFYREHYLNPGKYLPYSGVEWVACDVWLRVYHLGEAAPYISEPCVILASFNAG